MEIAENVRDFLVGMKETISPREETMLSNLQDLHERFTSIMNEFELKVSENALSMSPEARIVAHELRVRIYQDWRAKLTEYVFLAAQPEMSDTQMMDSGMTLIEDSTRKQSEDQRESLMSSIEDRLACFQSVVNGYIEVSTQVKTKRPILAPAVSKDDGCTSEIVCVSELDSDSFIFEIPDFLCDLTM